MEKYSDMKKQQLNSVYGVQATKELTDMITPEEKEELNEILEKAKIMLDWSCEQNDKKLYEFVLDTPAWDVYNLYNRVIAAYTFQHLGDITYARLLECLDNLDMFSGYTASRYELLTVKGAGVKIIKYSNTIYYNIRERNLLRGVGLEIINGTERSDVYNILIDYIDKTDRYDMAIILQMIFELHILTKDEIVAIYTGMRRI